MAIAQVGSTGTSVSTTAVTTVVLTCPASVVVGTLLLVGVSNVAAVTASVAMPAGWQELRDPQVAPATLMAGVFWRVADSTDVASSTTYTWTVASGQGIGIITGWSGVDPNSPFDGFTGAAPYAQTLKTTTSTTNTYPTVTTTTANALAVGFAFGRDNATGGTTNSATTPTSWTELADLQQTVLGSVNNATAQMVTIAVAVAGAVTAAASTQGLSQTAVVYTFSLRPDSGGAIIEPVATGAAIIGWYRGDDLSGADASSITSWPDHSAAGAALVNATAPTVSATASRNGVKVAKFVRASTQSMTTTARALVPVSVYCAFYNTILGAAGGLWGGQTALTAISGQINASNVFELDQESSSNLGVSTNSIGIGWHVIGVVYRPNVPTGVGSTRISLDGTISTPSTATPQPSHVALKIGVEGGASWDGYIAEILFYNGLHTAAEQDALVSYLQARWVPPPIPEISPYRAAVQRAATW